MADDLKDTIKQNAEGPAEARGDSGSVRQHGLKDQTRLPAGRSRRTSTSPARRRPPQTVQM